MNSDNTTNNINIKNNNQGHLIKLALLETAKTIKKHNLYNQSDAEKLFEIVSSI